jgi:DNA polymerase-3 subunit gamma/tau
VEPVRSLESVEVEQLTQEHLEAYWNQLLQEQADDEKFVALLADKKVELQNNNLFLIKVPNIYFDTLIREFQERINSFFRKATNNEALQYKVAVEVLQRESVAYMPREKFDAMAQRNPAMYSLRKLFPDIDF